VPTEYATLLNALRKRDVAGAERLFDEHVMAARDGVVTLLDVQRGVSLDQEDK
jgi:hypothetical protein